MLCSRELSRPYQNESRRFDAFFVVRPSVQGLLGGYTALTGAPFLPPLWGLFLGDSDCYHSEAQHSTPSMPTIHGHHLATTVKPTTRTPQTESSFLELQFLGIKYLVRHCPPVIVYDLLLIPYCSLLLLTLASHSYCSLLLLTLAAHSCCSLFTDHSCCPLLAVHSLLLTLASHSYCSLLLLTLAAHSCCLLFTAHSCCPLLLLTLY